MEYSRIAPMMGQLWSPIAAVTSRWGQVVNAQIAVAVGAASIVPSMPRVIVQIYKTNYSHELIYGSKAFALSFLRVDQLQHIKDFGLVSGRDVDKLAGVPYSLKASGSPVLEDCWGYLDCRVVNAMDGGDMTCFLGEVLDGDTLSEGEPLWWRYARTVIPDQWAQEWDRKIKAEIELSMKRMKSIDYTPWNL
jgi:flavin reductase (DIM6/NTAB) family NADH-FMN oxidoreductase RutF